MYGTRAGRLSSRFPILTPRGSELTSPRARAVRHEIRTKIESLWRRNIAQCRTQRMEDTLYRELEYVMLLGFRKCEPVFRGRIRGTKYIRCFWSREPRNSHRHVEWKDLGPVCSASVSLIDDIRTSDFSAILHTG